MVSEAPLIHQPLHLPAPLHRPLILHRVGLPPITGGKSNRLPKHLVAHDEIGLDRLARPEQVLIALLQAHVGAARATQRRVADLCRLDIGDAVERVTEAVGRQRADGRGAARRRVGDRVSGAVALHERCRAGRAGRDGCVSGAGNNKKNIPPV